MSDSTREHILTLSAILPRLADDFDKVQDILQDAREKLEQFNDVYVTCSSQNHDITEGDDGLD